MHKYVILCYSQSSVRICFFLISDKEVKPNGNFSDSSCDQLGSSFLLCILGETGKIVSMTSLVP